VPLTSPPPPAEEQLLPSIVLVSFVNEVFFKSESWPFSTPFASLHSILSGKSATQCASVISWLF
jgi:hypothetical protein